MRRRFFESKSLQGKKNVKFFENSDQKIFEDFKIWKSKKFGVSGWGFWFGFQKNPREKICEKKSLERFFEEFLSWK